MAAQWVFVSLMAWLALASAGKEGEGQRLVPLELTSCCHAEKMLALDTDNAKHCVESLGDLDAMGPPPSAEEVCKATECILDSNGLLDKDKAIKEKEFKTFFHDKATADAKAAVQAALDKCFDHHVTKNTDKKKENRCQTEMEPLMNCFTREVYIHCPDSLWNKEPQCDGAREKLAKFLQ